MKSSYQNILQSHLHHIHADVSTAAYSESAVNWKQETVIPDFYRLFFLTKGEHWFKLGEREYIGKPGQLFWIPAGLEHSFGTHGSESSGRFWCHFRANLGDIQLFELLQLPHFIQVRDDELVKGLFERMVDSYKEDQLTKGLRLNAALFEVLAYYFDSCELREENLACSESFSKLNDALHYIEEHLDTAISLDELAKAAYLHPNYFIGIFKNAMGCSPIQYVNQRRLERAKQLLVESDMSVTEVAAAAGMQNHYLSRLFKQQTGVSPSRYRQIYQLRSAEAILPGGKGDEGQKRIESEVRK